MAGFAFMPDTVVEVAFNAGYGTPAASRTWTDVSAYVEAQYGLQITRGRADEFADIQPSRLSLTLDNRDGRFTPGYTSGVYYPNVLKGRPIRVSTTWNAVTYRRFLGYVDEWPVVWPAGTGTEARVLVTASSRQATLGRKIFKSLVEEEILYDAPVAYYPLGEPAGSVSAANEATTAQNPLTIAQVGTGGTLTFGSGTGPQYDSLTAATLTPADFGNGKYLTAASTTAFSSAASIVFECSFVAADLSYTNTLVSLQQSGTTNYIALNVAASFVTVSYRSGGAGLGANASATVTTGVVNHLVGKITAGSTAVTLILNGTVLSGTLGAAPTFDTYDTILLGNDSTGATMFDGTMAHAAIYAGASVPSNARFQSHATVVTAGAIGESSDARVTRLANYAGIPTAEISTETGLSTSVGYEDITGKSAAEALLDVVHTENGALFDAGDGTLTFHARSHRYSTTSAFTLSATTQQIGSDLSPKVDDFGVINDATYAGTSGVTNRAVNAASITDLGTYADSASLLTTSDLEAADRANFMVNVHGYPQVRAATCSINNLTSFTTGNITSLLGLEIGTRITLSGLPSNAPASSMDFFIEGYTETLYQARYDMTFNLSPTSGLDFWKLGDATYGVLDSTTRLGY